MRNYFLTLLLLGMTAWVAVPASAQNPFVGEIDLVAFNFAPQGWAICQGQIVPINQNTALFSLLGTTYGGNGTTNFALPDLRGRRIISAGQGPGLNNYNLGDTGGEETVTLTVAQMPSHTHQVNANTAVGTALGPGGNVWASQTSTSLYSNSPTATANLAPQAIGVSGGSQSHENMPPYLVLNYIIAMEGIFPSRN
jgi:microcystin-dependent protein